MKSEELTVIFEPAARQKSKFFTTSLYHLHKKEQSFLHYHDVLELGICLSGNGRCMTDRGTVTYQAGNTQVIPPYLPHYDVSDSDDSHWMFMNIDIPRISSSHLSPDPAFFIELIQKSNAWGVFSAKVAPRIHALITDIASLMQAESNTKEAADDLLVAKLIALLIELSAEHAATCTPTENLKRNQSILPAMHCVSATLSKGKCPTPRQMADACFMSESYFRKIFTAVMGEPPKHYISRMQAQKAASLLMTTDSPASTIAITCGYEDHSTFYRSFSRIYGESPNEYRKKK